MLCQDSRVYLWGTEKSTLTPWTIPVNERHSLFVPMLLRGNAYLPYSLKTILAAGNFELENLLLFSNDGLRSHGGPQ